MRHTVDSWPGKLGVWVALTVMIFVAAEHLVARPAARLYPHFGLVRMSLLSESAEHGRVRVQRPVEGETRSLLPWLVAGILLLVLKTHRVPRRALTVRRLKLPRARSSSSLSEQH